jgi:hypothetical protein
MLSAWLVDSLLDSITELHHWTSSGSVATWLQNLPRKVAYGVRAAWPLSFRQKVIGSLRVHFVCRFCVFLDIL